MSGKNPDKIVYVMEFDIDTDKMVEVDYPVGGYNQDKSIKPGYFGPPDIDDGSAHPTTDSLEVIVWNESVSAKVVGAYVEKLTVDPTKGYTSGYYIRGSNFDNDSKSGNWTTDDLDEAMIRRISARISAIHASWTS